MASPKHRWLYPSAIVSSYWWIWLTETEKKIIQFGSGKNDIMNIRSYILCDYYREILFTCQLTIQWIQTTLSQWLFPFLAHNPQQKKFLFEPFMFHIYLSFVAVSPKSHSSTFRTIYLTVWTPYSELKTNVLFFTALSGAFRFIVRPLEGLLDHWKNLTHCM